MYTPILQDQFFCTPAKPGLTERLRSKPSIPSIVGGPTVECTGAVPLGTPLSISEASPPGGAARSMQAAEMGVLQQIAGVTRRDRKISGMRYRR